MERGTAFAVRMKLYSCANVFFSVNCIALNAKSLFFSLHTASLKQQSRRKK